MPNKANIVRRPTTAFLRLAGLAAVGFAAAIVLANLILVPSGLPRTGADTADVTAFFAAHRAALGVATALMPTAWALAALFGAGVAAVLRRTDHDQGWALFGFAGLVLQNGAFAGVAAIRLALAATAARNGDVTPLWALHDALFTLNGVFLAMALIGLSVGGMHAALIRKWQVGLGFIAAALLFGSATLAPLVVDHDGPLGLLGLGGWLLWVVWLVAYGVALIRRRPPLDNDVSPHTGTTARDGLGRGPRR
jgi:hypothetical protein